LLVEQMAKQEGVTEQLKAQNQMLWAGRMNNIRVRAEEIVREEIIYQLFHRYADASTRHLQSVEVEQSGITVKLPIGLTSSFVILTVLIDILGASLFKKRIGAQELADMFEVSPRTIYRDIDPINLTGIPIPISQYRELMAALKLCRSTRLIKMFFRLPIFPQF